WCRCRGSRIRQPDHGSHGRMPSSGDIGDGVDEFGSATHLSPHGGNLRHGHEAPHEMIPRCVIQDAGPRRDESSGKAVDVTFQLPLPIPLELHGLGDEARSSITVYDRDPAKHLFMRKDLSCLVQWHLTSYSHHSIILDFGIMQVLAPYLGLPTVGSNQNVADCGRAVGEERGNLAVGASLIVGKFFSELNDVLDSRQQQLLQYHRARRSQSYDRLSAANLGCLQTVAKKLTKVFRIYSQVPWWLRACYNKSLVQVRRKDI